MTMTTVSGRGTPMNADVSNSALPALDAIQLSQSTTSAEPLKLSLNCIECRARKVKCDRGHPCSQCVARGLEAHCRKDVLQKPARKKQYNTLARKLAAAEQSTIVSSLLPSVSGSDVQMKSSTGSETRSVLASQSQSHVGPVIMQPAQDLSMETDLASAQNEATYPVDISQWQSDRHEPEQIAEADLTRMMLDQLFGFAYSHDPIPQADQQPHIQYSSTPSTSASSFTPSITHESSLSEKSDHLGATVAIGPRALLHTLCIQRLFHDANVLDGESFRAYREAWPSHDEVISILPILQKRAQALSSNRETGTFLDYDTYCSVLQRHCIWMVAQQGREHLAAMPNAQSVTTEEGFFLLCGFAFGASPSHHGTTQDQQHISSATLDRLLQATWNLSRQLTGTTPSLMLLQAYRMLALASMWCDQTAQSVAAIFAACRIAGSMGIHHFATLSQFPARERVFLKDAVLSILCQACVMQALYGLELPLSPTSVDASIFDLDHHGLPGNPTLASLFDETINKILPLRLRMFASAWILIERQYQHQGRLMLPTEDNLSVMVPVERTEQWELDQLAVLNDIFKRCSFELEAPLSKWLSATMSVQSAASRDEEPGEDPTTSAQGLALQMQYILRYLRIVINHPFRRVSESARRAVEDTARAIISTTWRMARRPAHLLDGNLELYGHLCLRAMVFHAAAYRPNHKMTTSARGHEGDGTTQMNRSISLGRGGVEQIFPPKDTGELKCTTDNLEQVISDMEQGQEALERLVTHLHKPSRLDALAAELCRPL